MRVAVKHGSVVFLPDEEELELGRLPLTTPVDDVLALGMVDPSDQFRTQKLLDFYIHHDVAWLKAAAFGAASDLDAALWTAHDAFVASVETDQGGPAFVRACTAAETRELSRDLAPYLEKVRWGARGTPDWIPDHDLAALAAWCLFQAMIRQDIELRPCDNCHLPWLGTASGSPFCARPAPHRFSRCRELMKQARFRRDTRSYRAEYKRLHAARQRGQLPDHLWAGWRRDNTPDTWELFIDWFVSTGAEATLTSQQMGFLRREFMTREARNITPSEA